jgi:hypothetical protein
MPICVYMYVLWSVPEITQATCFTQNIYRGRILGRNSDKSLESFPPCYSKSPRHLCTEISISSNSRNLLQFLHFVTVHCKGERRRNPYRKLKSDNSQDYAQKPKINYTFMNSASELAFCKF